MTCSETTVKNLSYGVFAVPSVSEQHESWLLHYLLFSGASVSTIP